MATSAKKIIGEFNAVDFNQIATPLGTALTTMNGKLKTAMDALSTSEGSTAAAAEYQKVHGQFQTIFSAMTNSLAGAKKMSGEALAQVGR